MTGAARWLMAPAVLVGAAFATAPQPCASDEAALVPDLRLQQAIRAELGLAADQPLTETLLASVDELSAAGDPAAGDVICSLEGLDKAAGLKKLDLADNRLGQARIADFTPLRALTSLTSLNLRATGIVDLRPLTELVSLAHLNLSANAITNVQALARLSSLRSLNLSDNRIESVAALAGLTGLRSLYLGDNDLVEVSALSRLRQLENLSLENNRLSSLQPLVTNPGIGSGDTVDVEHNCLDLSPESIESRRAKILVDRGVTLTDANQRTDCGNP